MRTVHAGWRDLPPEPWKNGGGVTRTLAVDEAAAPPRWRVSIADIDADGPYSRFAGYDRVSVVLSGAGVALRGDGVALSLLPGVAAGFPGEAAVQSRLLDGPTRVLNLFVLRGAAQASVWCAGAERAMVLAGSLEDAARATSGLRIAVTAQDFFIDPCCPGDGPGDGPVEPAWPQGTVHMVLRMLPASAA